MIGSPGWQSDGGNQSKVAFAYHTKAHPKQTRETTMVIADGNLIWCVECQREARECVCLDMEVGEDELVLFLGEEDEVPNGWECV